jgi:hypothetical protein
MPQGLDDLAVLFQDELGVALLVRRLTFWGG